MQKERGVILGITELDELQELARLATREALESYDIPDEWKERLSLGVFFEDDDRIFELYVTGDKPDDATVISTARVNRNTKAVSVVISNLEKKASSGQTHTRDVRIKAHLSTSEQCPTSIYLPLAS